MVYSTEKIIPTKKIVEEKLKTMGDYVKMDYLSGCLKNSLDFETRKFVLTTLSRIYESRAMYSEAGKLIKASADINTTFDSKIGDFMKAVELFVKAGNYDEADNTFNKAIVLGNQIQKGQMKARRKELYFAQAQEFMKRDKRTHAAETFEKCLTLELSDIERKMAQNALLDLYQKLGKIRDYYNLKKSGDSRTIVPDKHVPRKSFLPDRKESTGRASGMTWDVDSI